MEDPYTNLPRKRKKSKRIAGKPARSGTIFEDFCAGGAPVWMKMIGSAVATPVIVLVGIARAGRGGGITLPQNGMTYVGILGGSVVLGAFLGGLLSLKDVVQDRLSSRKPVPFPLKLLFGFGIWSLLLVWFPGVLILTLAVTVIVLSTAV